MNIQYNKQKQEVKDDPVLGLFISARKYFEEQKKNLGIGAMVIVGVVLVGFFMQSTRESSLKKANDAFGKAMVAYESGDAAATIEGFTQVTRAYKGTPFASYSAYILGSLYFSKGEYAPAIIWLQSAIASNGGFISGEATEALATCYENQGTTDKAIQYYQKALTDTRISYRFPTIRYKLALLLSDKGQPQPAIKYLQQIISDTTLTAQEYREKSQIVLAGLTAAKVQ